MQSLGVAVPAIGAAPSGFLQRQCACGGQSAAGGDCKECKKEGEDKDQETRLQRQAKGPAQLSVVPQSVRRTLNSGGSPLATEARAFMEPRFGQDFSRVRVHTDAKAGESARAVNAIAWTMGEHIAFQPRSYNPASESGRRLLAHELTHVVQNRRYGSRAGAAISHPGDAAEHEAEGVAQQVMRGDPAMISAPPQGALLRLDADTAEKLKIGGAIGGAVVGAVGLGLGIAALAGGFISDKDLREYLQKLDDTGKIEGGFQSDQKARRIAESWGKGETKFQVTIRRKPLLVLEMLDGHVSHWDKDGIMNILERSDDADLNYMFGPGGLSHATLIKKLDSWKDEVARFYKRRYKGVDINVLKDYSGLKAESTGPIQPGDEIPQEDTEFFNPLSITKRRTKQEPIKSAESDKWVGELYGPYLPKEKSSHYIEKQVDVNVATDKSEDDTADAQFAAAQQSHCQKERDWLTDKKKEENGGKPLSPEDKRQLKDRYEYCMNNPSVAGFYESAEESGEKKPQIWVHRGRETATTRLHESLHAYANPGVASKLPHFASEGLTEYFTRQIALRKNLAISASYEGPFLAIQEFSARFGEDVLKQVYFQGQLNLICRKLVERFGEGTYKDWATAMSSEDSWADAVAVMQRPKVAQPPKDPAECNL